MPQLHATLSHDSKYSASSHSSPQDLNLSTESKNCKLCRKKLSNEHFYNPKTGGLFSVCDICRKRKRDKYWRNKELLQQTAMDTRMSTRNRVNRQRKETSYSTTNKKVNTSEVSSPSSTGNLSSASMSQGNTCVPYNSPHTENPLYVNYPCCSVSTPGSLIVIPPQVSNFILANRNNPSFIRSCIGDYYWKVLCM